MLAALNLLVALPARSADRRWGSDCAIGPAVAKTGTELLARQAYLPPCRKMRGRTLRLAAILDQPADRARLRVLVEAMPPVCRACLLRRPILIRCKFRHPTRLWMISSSAL